MPRPLLMQRIGKERLYTEAVESHIGGWFWNAATRARVNPVAQPEYDYELPASESEDWQLLGRPSRCSRSPSRPTGRRSRCRSTRPRCRRRRSSAELEALQRIGRRAGRRSRAAPRRTGDTVVVDLIAEDGSAQRDYVVELGSERLVEEIENGIRGLAPGESARSPTSSADGSAPQRRPSPSRS